MCCSSISDLEEFVLASDKTDCVSLMTLQDTQTKKKALTERFHTLWIIQLTMQTFIDSMTLKNDMTDVTRPYEGILISGFNIFQICFSDYS